MKRSFCNRDCSWAISSSSSPMRRSNSGGLRRAQQRLTRLEQLLQLCPQWCADGDAPRQDERIERTMLSLVGLAIADHAGPAQLEAVDPGQMALDQIGQRQVLEQEIENSSCEIEMRTHPHPRRILAGIAAAPPPPAAVGSGDLVAGDELLVAGVDDAPVAASAMVEHGLADLLLRDGDLLARVQVGQLAPGHGVGDRLLDVRPVALQKRCRFTLLLFLPLRRRSTM
jgi:hypothetical protein